MLFKSPAEMVAEAVASEQSSVDPESGGSGISEAGVSGAFGLTFFLGPI